MKYTAAIALAILTASPAFANYGDLDAQLASLELTSVQVAQPLTSEAQRVSDAAVCDLPFTHIVEVPAAFASQTGVDMACLEE